MDLLCSYPNLSLVLVPTNWYSMSNLKCIITSSTLYKESLVRSTSCITISELIAETAVVTADGEGFCDALRCMYFLIKKEMAHTTNFSDLQDFCILLGNDTLPRLLKGKNLNNRSEQRW